MAEAERRVYFLGGRINVDHLPSSPGGSDGLRVAVRYVYYLYARAAGSDGLGVGYDRHHLPARAACAGGLRGVVRSVYYL